MRGPFEVRQRDNGEFEVVNSRNGFLVWYGGNVRSVADEICEQRNQEFVAFAETAANIDADPTLRTLKT